LAHPALSACLNTPRGTQDACDKPVKNRELSLQLQSRRQYPGLLAQQDQSILASCFADADQARLNRCLARRLADLAATDGEVFE